MKFPAIACCLLALVGVAACSDEPDDNSYVTPTEPSTPGTPEQQMLLEEFVDEKDRHFTIPGPHDAPRKPTFSGEWTKRDGAWECDGYLTRLENEVHCAPSVPDDWIPFEFEGETFYVAPLSVDD